MSPVEIVLTGAVVLLVVLVVLLFVAPHFVRPLRQTSPSIAKGGAARALPVVTEPAEEAMPEPDPLQRCQNCAHFDYEEGQALMQQAGPFWVAKEFVPMIEMGAVATPEGEIPARDIPASAQWGDSGLCQKRHEVLWGGTDAERRHRMQGGADGKGAPGTFLEDGVDCWEPKA